MENEIKVTITPTHFSSSNNYIFNCPLEMSLKEQFPGAEISVGSDNVSINGDGFHIPEIWGRHFSSTYPPSAIERIIDKSKISLEEIPTIEFTLTKL